MKKIIFFTVIALATLSMVHSIESIYSLWQKRDIILETKKSLAQEQKENKKLKQNIGTISHASFVEEEARNKLFMVKPGEKVVVIPSDDLATSSSEPQVQEQQLSNWEQWWKLFFN